MVIALLVLHWPFVVITTEARSYHIALHCSPNNIR